MAEIGACTVKILPDLTEFKELLGACDIGLTVIETTTCEYDSADRLVRQVRTTVVGKK